MSFIDGIVQTAKSVLGIESSDPASAPERDGAARQQHVRSANRAIDTPTAFSPATAPDPAAAPGGVVPPAAAHPTAARAVVTDAHTRTRLGTVDTIAGGTEGAVAAANVQRGLDYYASRFGRDGIDGAGRGVDVLVDDRTKDARGNERFAGNGGYYETRAANGSTSEAIHFGRGTRSYGEHGLIDQRAMYHADDLTIHEFTHGVIRAETGHLGGSSNEVGATNEAIADVMAAAATRDWRIGEGMFRPGSDYTAMRDIARPDDPTAVHGLWTSMQDVEAARRSGEDVEEHWASGVISTAAYRVQQRLGGGEAGWQAVEQVVYDAIDGGRLGDMTFEATAAGLRAAAAARYGSGSAVAQVFDEELRRGGL